MNQEKKHFVEFVAGDWSRDGHGMTEKITYACTHDASFVQKAIKQGQKKAGVKLDGVCRNYDDSHVPENVAMKLIEAGYKGFEYEEGAELDTYVSAELWIDIHMFLATLASPEIEFQPVASGEILVGGYGLFST